MIDKDWTLYFAKDKTLAKSYFNLLVDEIVVKDYSATMKGSYQALAYAASQDKIKVGTGVRLFH